MAHFTLTEDQQNRLADLCGQYRVEQLRLFGSAASGDFDPDSSDLDFLVSFAEPGAGMSLATQFFGFQEALADLFRRPIDLLEDHMVDNPYLKKSAEDSAITLYAA